MTPARLSPRNPIVSTHNARHHARARAASVLSLPVLLSLTVSLALGPLLLSGCGTTARSADAGAVTGSRAAQESRPDARAVRAMQERISADRLTEHVQRLADFGTRHTMSDTTSAVRGIGAARRWIRDAYLDAVAETGRLGALEPRVYFDTHTVVADGRRILRDVDVVNVICEIPGAMPEAREQYVYVLAHYDSRATDALDAESDAPGANDDASGVAVLIELARVLSRERLDATVVLMATAGEEQGLYGARRHAIAAREQNKAIRAVLNNDTVGDPGGPGGRSARFEIRLFSEGLPIDVLGAERGVDMAYRRIRGFSSEADSPSRQLARAIEEVAHQQKLPVTPRVIYRPDRFLRGGDHTGFNEAGYPAVRFIEVYEDYTRQHQDVRVEGGVRFGDLPAYVSGPYMADVTLLNAVAIQHLANAPSQPTDVRMDVRNLVNDTTLRWTRSPEPDTAGYEVVWRATTSPTWDRVLDVRDVTEATVNLSKDNWFFGVRAYDTHGHRSPVVFPDIER